MTNSTSIRHVLAATLVALLASGFATETWAQSAVADRREKREREEQAREREQQAEVTEVASKYPEATREEPEAKPSRDVADELEAVFAAYEADDAAQTVPLADALIANEDANAYDRSISARLAAATLIGSDDARAQAYLRKAIEFNGLDNNDHYDSMLLLAQLQMQAEQDAQGLATVEKVLAETSTDNPEVLAIKGSALYRLERFPEAAATLKTAVEGAGDQAQPQWLQMLMASYFDMQQPEQAAAIAEGLLADNPDDKNLQMNLASIYMQSDQTDKATALLEKLRASGQLSEDRDYRNLYAMYINTEGGEQKAIEVIQEGIQKGILEPDYQTYVALAQSYYFTDQPGPAIENYSKAAPLAPDGETYLNLARILWQEGRSDEARTAAQQALDKGLDNPQDAKDILAQAQ